MIRDNLGIWLLNFGRFYVWFAFFIDAEMSIFTFIYSLVYLVKKSV